MQAAPSAHTRSTDELAAAERRAGSSLPETLPETLLPERGSTDVQNPPRARQGVIKVVSRPLWRFDPGTKSHSPSRGRDLVKFPCRWLMGYPKRSELSAATLTAANDGWVLIATPYICNAVAQGIKPHHEPLHA